MTNRSIPQGAISAAEAKKFGIILTALGVLISLFISIPIFLALFIYALILLLYNMKYKKSIFKNLIVGIALVSAYTMGFLILEKCLCNSSKITEIM